MPVELMPASDLFLILVDEFDDLACPDLDLVIWLEATTFDLVIVDKCTIFAVEVSEQQSAIIEAFDLCVASGDLWTLKGDLAVRVTSNVDEIVVVE